MKLKKTILTLCFYYFLTTGYACTTFVLKTTNDLVFGRNLDWVSDNGIIVTNKRKVSKKALVLPPNKGAIWVSKYGSVTFNQFGKEFPFGGIIERGLVIEIMLADAQYPLKDERPAINELQWIQYQLDNSANIEDVIKSDKSLRISMLNQELHFLICDSTGQVAVIEFVNNKMLVYKGKSLPHPVLENSTYKNALENYKNKAKCRFNTVVKMLGDFDNQNNTSAIDYSFKILDKVKLDGSWSIVYDIKNMQIHLKTVSNSKVRTVHIKDFDFNCDTKPQIYDLKKLNEGNINGLFITFNSTLNNSKIDDAIKTNKIELPQDFLLSIRKESNYLECKN